MIRLRIAEGVTVCTTVALLAATGRVPRAQQSAHQPYAADASVSGEISSMGDPAMAALMDRLIAAFARVQRDVRKGSPWAHRSAATAVPALLFELADIAPLARELKATELAPYAHQFAGDMMKSPLTILVGRDPTGAPAYLAVNKRPDSPLPMRISQFLRFALSREGQAIVAAEGSFRPLTPDVAEGQRAKIDAYLAALDPALPPYRATGRVSGSIDSVGSDGMKSLMERWMRDFRRTQPGVRKGDRWEHLGTLNGLHALVAHETALAPMGRELWDDERAAYASTHDGRVPIDVRVARGGFNTPQRTTAQAIFVHQANPITRITIEQIAAIFGEPATVTRLGQLGLEGEWRDLPIAAYMPPRQAPNAMSMHIRVLKGGTWNVSAREASVADTAAAAARDRGSIAFGGFEDGGFGLKTLAVGEEAGGPFYEGTAETVSNGRYPLSRYLFIRLEDAESRPTTAAVKEFLRFILSRDGQEPVRYSGYFPLLAAEARDELAKLR